jgi:hypothetical protein
MFFGYDDVSLPVILGANNNLVIPILTRVDCNLNFRVWVYANIEDLSMAGKPGIRPTTVITDAYGCDTVDDKERFMHI